MGLLYKDSPNQCSMLINTDQNYGIQLLQNMASGHIKVKKRLAMYFTWPLPVTLLRVYIAVQCPLTITQCITKYGMNVFIDLKHQSGKNSKL